MGMNITSEDLLFGESVVMSKKANLVISLKEFGLSRLPIDNGQLAILGMDGKEAVGGMAHLTNYRIIFKPHFFNRVRGIHSIFLPNLKEVSSTFLNLIVETSVHTYTFVMWFKREFINAIRQQQEFLLQDGVDKLRDAIRSSPKTLGGNLYKVGTFDSLNKAIEIFKSSKMFIDAFTNADKSSFLEILELFTEENDGKDNLEV